MPLQYIVLGIFDEPQTMLAKAKLKDAGAEYVYKEPHGVHETVKWLNDHNISTYPIILRPDGERVGGVEELVADLEANFVPIAGDADAPEIFFRRMSDVATIPTYGSDEAAGMDLYMASSESHGSPYPSTAIASGDRRLIQTNIQTIIPAGHYGRIAPRSGLADKRGIVVLAGVVDSDYRGDIGVLLLNTSKTTQIFTCGDRIAQLIIEKMSRPRITVVEELEMSDRGEGGFGSTGS